VKSLGESKPRVPTADGQREEENRIVVIRLGR
jgi:outer membrane protein OmpA-like peptidoglycan-associated protein